MDDRSKQVVAQCKVVARLATILASVHTDYAKFLHHDLVDMVGERTAGLMEQLGNILNDMDAVSEDDEWMEPVFDEAHRLWPTKP